MLTTAPVARLELNPGQHRESFDREPFGFTHNLHELDLFEIETLKELAQKFARHPRDFYVAGGAPTPDAQFYSVRHLSYSPYDALCRLDEGAYRVLLKRPENHDRRYRDLMDALFQQIVEFRGGLRRERLVRLELGILISSAATITPFHFDPELNFFMQIEGEKTYHVFSPSSLTEPELEKFYIRGVINIGQVDLQARDKAREHTFPLRPGLGLHQPQNAAHWVETRAERSISLAIVFETDATRARSRVRAFNHYQRKLLLNPAMPGAHPVADSIKATSMRAMIPVRKVIVRACEEVEQRTRRFRPKRNQMK